MRFDTWSDYHKANNLQRNQIRHAGSSEDAALYEIAAVLFLDFSDAKIAATRSGRYLSKNKFIAQFMKLFGLKAMPLPQPESLDSLRLEPFSVRFSLIERWETEEKAGSTPESAIADCLDRFHYDDINCFRTGRLVDPLPFVQQAVQALQLIEADAIIERDIAPIESVVR